MLKDMEDGSKVLGIFNFSEEPRKITVALEEIGLDGKQKVRDLWRQRNLWFPRSRIKRKVSAHSVALLRLWDVD